MINLRSILTLFFLLLCFFFFLVFIDNAQAEPQWLENIGGIWDGWKKTAEKGVKDPLIKWHYHWKDGLNIDSKKKNLKIRINGRVIVDGGYIGDDVTLQEAFPDFQGGHANFRDLRMILTGTAYDHIDFKFDIDFANVRDIKDIWIGYTKAPFFGDIKVGHFREPISLERLTGLDHITFMERALPTEAFSPGRNMGIMCNNTILDERMTWAAGAFLITGSFDDAGEFSDKLSEAFGTALTARVTGLPRYADNGRQLLHLGLSYSHQFRNEQRAESDLKLRTHPESRLTNDVLVNTEAFPAEGANIFGGELAMVSGPLSFQGEYFLLFADSNEADNPGFWGFYLYGSYFITGEHRNYDRSNGVFSGIKPKNDFHLFDGGWGALEAALRFSYVDLNGKSIRGGREHNLTAGLNWYLSEKTRFMFNYVRAKVKNRETPPLIEDGIADILQVRFQITF